MTPPDPVTTLPGSDYVEWQVLVSDQAVALSRLYDELEEGPAKRAACAAMQTLRWALNPIGFSAPLERLRHYPYTQET